jgi:hypothetical protein
MSGTREGSPQGTAWKEVRNPALRGPPSPRALGDWLAALWRAGRLTAPDGCPRDESKRARSGRAK